MVAGYVAISRGAAASYDITGIKCSSNGISSIIAAAAKRFLPLYGAGIIYFYNPVIGVCGVAMMAGYFAIYRVAGTGYDVTSIPGWFYTVSVFVIGAAI